MCVITLSLLQVGMGKRDGKEKAHTPLERELFMLEGQSNKEDCLKDDDGVYRGYRLGLCEALTSLV